MSEMSVLETLKAEGKKAYPLAIARQTASCEWWISSSIEDIDYGFGSTELAAWGDALGPRCKFEFQFPNKSNVCGFYAHDGIHVDKNQQYYHELYIPAL